VRAYEHVTNMKARRHTARQKDSRMILVSNTQT